MANWFENILGDIGRGLAHPFTVQHPSNPFAKDPSQSTPAQPTQQFNPQDTITQFLSAYGNPTTPTQITNWLKVKDPESLSNPTDLGKSLSEIAKLSNWNPFQQQQQSPLDPLSVQMFYQQTVAPYMQQLSQNEQATSKALGSFTPIAGLSPELNQVLSRGAQTQAQDLNNAFSTAQQAAAYQPQVDQLLNQLAAKQTQALRDYYQMVNLGTTQGSGLGAYVPGKSFKG